MGGLVVVNKLSTRTAYKRSLVSSLNLCLLAEQNDGRTRSGRTSYIAIFQRKIVVELFISLYNLNRVTHLTV